MTVVDSNAIKQYQVCFSNRNYKGLKFGSDESLFSKKAFLWSLFHMYNYSLLKNARDLI